MGSRDRLTRFYARYNPEKLQQPQLLDEILSHYNGREEKLFRKLRKKYGVPEPTTPAEFCLAIQSEGSNVKQTWAGLRKEDKTTLLEVSKFCIAKHQGDEELAQKIITFNKKTKRVLPPYMYKKKSAMNGEDEPAPLWPVQYLEVAVPHIRDYMVASTDPTFDSEKNNYFLGCKDFIKSLQPEQIDVIRWRDINERFTPPGWEFRVQLAPEWQDINPTICQLGTPRDESSQGCSEYYNKCRWIDYLQQLSIEEKTNLIRGSGLLTQSNEYRLARADFPNYRPMVLDVVRENGHALRWASEELRDDRLIVMTAVQNNGMVLRNVSERLQQDREVVFEAVKNKRWVFEHITEEFRSDPEIARAALQEGFLLKFAGENIKDTKELVLLAIENARGYWIMQHITSELLRGDRDIALATIKSDPLTIQYLTNQLKDDEKLARMAVDDDERAMEHVSDRLYQMLLHQGYHPENYYLQYENYDYSDRSDDYYSDADCGHH